MFPLTFIFAENIILECCDLLILEEEEGSMSEQDGTNPSIKHSKLIKVNKQSSNQASTLKRPINDDEEVWRAYWRSQEQALGPWRMEPEIDSDRQKYLTERRSITANIEQGIYSFKDIKLNRADVEWLLATHENGQGPVNWSDESQRKREGLDLRGANLQGEDLRGLPLACMIGGLTGRTWFYASPEQCDMAAVRMKGAILIQAHLEGAKLNQAYLERANLFRANLEEAEFRAAYLEGAYLNETYLGGTLLRRAHLEGVNLSRAHLEGVSTPPADLRGAFFDSATVLTDITLGNKVHGYVLLADVSWGGVNLSRIDWSPVDMLGHEHKAYQTKDVDDYRTAVRANRQLSVALQVQGLNEDAARFAYRAQRLQRVVLRRQRKFGSYLFSLFLDLLAGYGYIDQDEASSGTWLSLLDSQLPTIHLGIFRH
jgi:uncharacterized protein YjbI with pentapeptide repeats